MKRVLLVCLLLAAVLLSACEAESPRETEAPAMQTAETAADPARFACDAVFFGDSITCDGNFAELFPELRVVNLGVYGDTLEDLLRRVPEVRAEKPAAIFLLGGINCLRPGNVADCLSQYRDLLDALAAACPGAAIRIQSVLPVAADIDPDGRENEAVRRFNEGLRELADLCGYPYIDLWSVYEKDGALNPAQTRDGLHLNFNAYGPWADAVRPFLGE